MVLEKKVESSSKLTIEINRKLIHLLLTYIMTTAHTDTHTWFDQILFASKWTRIHGQCHHTSANRLPTNSTMSFTMCNKIAALCLHWPKEFNKIEWKCAHTESDKTNHQSLSVAAGMESVALGYVVITFIFIIIVGMIVVVAIVAVAVAVAVISFFMPYVLCVMNSCLLAYTCTYTHTHTCTCCARATSFCCFYLFIYNKLRF